jgi:hypothetical protein
MKPWTAGILIAMPICWAAGGMWVAIFSAAGSLAIYGAISYAVGKGWIR